MPSNNPDTNGERTRSVLALEEPKDPHVLIIMGLSADGRHTCPDCINASSILETHGMERRTVFIPSGRKGRDAFDPEKGRLALLKESAPGIYGRYQIVIDAHTIGGEIHVPLLAFVPGIGQDPIYIGGAGELAKQISTLQQLCESSEKDFEGIRRVTREALAAQTEIGPDGVVRITR